MIQSANNGNVIRKNQFFLTMKYVEVLEVLVVLKVSSIIVILMI